MKEKVIAVVGSVKEVTVVSGGFTAPYWMQAMNGYTGWLIGIFTLAYVIWRCFDAYYQWKINWNIRKIEKKDFEDFLKSKNEGHRAK